MPELPDLLYIQPRLQAALTGRRVITVQIRQPIILRSFIDRPPAEILEGLAFTGVSLRGPFIRLTTGSGVDIIVNLMLAGRLHIQEPGDKAPGHLCLSLALDNGTRLNLCDDEKMAKVYLVRSAEAASVPRYGTQGIDVLSVAFTEEAFAALAAQHRRKQVRVFINDHSILSAIGNAYADEILWEARIHPKSLVASLTPARLADLHRAITGTLAWGAAAVREASQPIHVKVREHMRVRNRHGEPCPRCGSTIRREGVRGHDVFFCPACQPATRRHFIDWTAAGGGHTGEPPAE
jgi:formamidopyrimidine-DNA glycosylase